MGPKHLKNDFWKQFFSFLRLVYKKDPLLVVKFPVVLGIFVIAPLRGEIAFELNETLIVVLLIVAGFLILNVLCQALRRFLQ